MTQLMHNRYVWTDFGPCQVQNAALYSTAQVRKWMYREHGLIVKSWARNFMAFYGWVTVQHLVMPAKVLS